MFVRFLQLKIKPAEIKGMARLYEDKILPALQSTGGCTCAFLMQSAYRPEEAISLTLWQSEDASSIYERSGLFMRLVAEARPFFAESTDWKLQLSEDLKLEYRADGTEPELKRFSVSTTTHPSIPSREKPGQTFLRIVAVHLKPGGLEEYKQLYERDIIPTLVATRGCSYACLLTPSENDNEALSVTVWQSRSDAEEYERTGIFKKLLQSVSHVFSDFSQLSMQSAGTRLPSVSSDDVQVEGYHLLAGRSF